MLAEVAGLHFGERRDGARGDGELPGAEVRDRAHLELREVRVRMLRDALERASRDPNDRRRVMTFPAVGVRPPGDSAK